MMAMVEEQLLKALEELTTDKLKKFKWFLKNNGSVSTSDLEKADKATGTVDVMVERFEPDGAVKITLDILGKMNENHLAKQLENWTATTEKNEPINPKKDEPHLNIQQPEQVDGRNAPVSVRQLQPIQSNWKRPDKITPCTQESKDKILRENRDNVYKKNKSQRKGSALLITNIKFKYLKYRDGAERDEENMEWLLEALGYSVEKHTNLTGEEIEAEVKKFAALPDHKDSDSTFVVIMSHGKRIDNKDAILGVNYHKDLNPSDFFFVDEIFTHLNSKNCPALIDKPKVILIQACRGDHPGGVKMSDRALDSDAEDSALESDTWVHREKDFACFMSTLPDIKAYRNTVSGSYLIIYIVEVFCEWAQDTHIMELFGKVTSGMAKRPGREENKLLPCIERTSLTKKFFLFPGL